MPVTIGQVETIFNHLNMGENNKFFEQVADYVCWTVMGTHPLEGTHNNKQEFISCTFGRLNKILKEGAVLKVNNIIVQGDTAVVEMESLSTAINNL